MATLNKCRQRVNYNVPYAPCKVVPQFGIAKLVNITPITIWFMVDISN